MTSQLDFLTPMARKTAPPGSHEAADRVESSGALKGQRLRALGLVHAHPCRTTAELALAAWPEDVLQRERTFRMLGRRLPELEQHGHIKSDRDTRETGELRWWVTP